MSRVDCQDEILCMQMDDEVTSAETGGQEE